VPLFDETFGGNFFDTLCASCFEVPFRRELIFYSLAGTPLLVFPQLRTSPLEQLTLVHFEESLTLLP